MSALLEAILTPANIGAAVTAILTLFAGYLARLAHSEVRRRNVAIAIRHAYLAVEEFARLDARENALDKVAAGLRAANEWMIANGWRPLTEAERGGAKLAFSALSAQEHLTVKAATTAAVAAQLGGAAAVPTSPRAS